VLLQPFSFVGCVLTVPEPYNANMLSDTEQATPPISQRIAAQLARPVLAFANHLIAAEPQAEAELAPHAGKHFAVSLNAHELPRLRVSAVARLELAVDEDKPPHLRVQIDTAQALKLLAEGKSPAAAATISGEAGFAQSVGWLFANLRWESGADLARLIGEAPAQMIEDALKAAAKNLRETAQGASGMLKRGLDDSRAPLLNQSGIAGLRADVRSLRDDIARLEQRIELVRQAQEKRAG
jgi:ubiquinone biosynthesis accessory factor UbiJ